MEKQLRDILARIKSKDAEVTVELWACALRRWRRGSPGRAGKRLLRRARPLAGTKPALPPLHRLHVPVDGVPSACFACTSEGAHTREEWVELSSIGPGMQAAMSVLLNWFDRD